MKIDRIKTPGGYIAKNPMTGSWFVWIGERIGADYICDSKREAIKIAAKLGKH
jgi:hypothetical protein